MPLKGDTKTIFGKTLYCNVDRAGDLLHKMYIRMKLLTPFGVADRIVSAGITIDSSNSPLILKLKCGTNLRDTVFS